MHDQVSRPPAVPSNPQPHRLTDAARSQPTYLSVGGTVFSFQDLIDLEAGAFRSLWLFVRAVKDERETLEARTKRDEHEARVMTLSRGDKAVVMIGHRAGPVYVLTNDPFWFGRGEDRRLWVSLRPPGSRGLKSQFSVRATEVEPDATLTPEQRAAAQANGDLNRRLAGILSK